MALPRILREGMPLDAFMPPMATAADDLGKGATQLLAIEMTVPDQEKDEWCWAAVCAGVHHAFTRVLPTPCQMAGEVLGFDCCNDPGVCNTAMYLTSALARLNYYDLPDERQMKFADIRQEIAEECPVCCFIDYGTDIGHFIVINAVDTHSESVGILDPAPGKPHHTPQFIPWKSLSAAYGSGQWKETYRTKPRT